LFGFALAHCTAAINENPNRRQDVTLLGIAEMRKLVVEVQEGGVAGGSLRALWVR